MTEDLTETVDDLVADEPIYFQIQRFLDKYGITWEELESWDMGCGCCIEAPPEFLPYEHALESAYSIYKDYKIEYLLGRKTHGSA